MGARILIVDDSRTIRKVVADILQRNDYETMGAVDGIEALEILESEGKPDLMLVDFVMPRMNGYQLCISVRQNELFSDVPIVLMSAKGDRIRGKFVQQTGALDAITKPFDSRGLLAVIESALQKRKDAPTRINEGVAEDEHPSRESWGDVTNRDQSILSFAGRVSDLLLDKWEDSSSTPDRAKIAIALSLALTPEVSAELGRSLSDAALAEGGEEALSGDLASISIAEILQLLELQRKTGTLTLSHGKRRVNLFLRDGGLDFANQEGLPSEFLLGRYLIEKGDLAREELERHLASAKRSDQRLGEYLVSEDVLSAEILREALVQQTSELIYEIVRWRKGRFRFVQAEVSEHEADLGLRAPGLVMEGFRRVDEWRLIEDSFDFEDVLFRDELAIDNMSEHEEIQPEEKLALQIIDGDATVGEIIDKLGGSSFEGCKVLYRLLNGRLVKRRTN